MLSFVTGGEVGPAVTAGMDSAGKVVRAEWGAPRSGTGQWRWCPDDLVNAALPALAQGFTTLAANPTLEAALDRAINLYLAANSRQVLDVRIPVACTALELLAWAVLQHHQWVTAGSFDSRWAAANLRLLLHLAGIPIEIPSAFVALDRRCRRLGQTDLAAPDVVTNVRNELVHPPKKAAKLMWPTSEELQETWRLTMHYVELVILRVLEYDGEYLPRLQLTRRWVTDTEIVPWSQ